MKIGIDSRAAKWYRGTGIGTYAYQLVKKLSRLDRLNSYLLFYPDLTLTDIEADDNIIVKAITEQPKSTPGENFWEEVDIPNLLTDTGIDVYLVPQNGIGLPIEKHCPFVATLHDVIPFRMPETVGPQYLQIFQREVPNLLKRCDALLTVSEFSKADILASFDFPADRIFTTHLAAEEIYYPRNKKKCRQLLEASYGIRDNFILYVGGFSPRKNIKGLIRAFSMAKSKLPGNWKLVILGKKGRSYYEYRDCASELGVKEEVIFTGFVPMNELPIFYNAAEIFCYPSFYEGFGLPPVEAMACGTPTIAARTSSLPEVLGDAVLFIDPADEADIAEKLLLVANDENLKRKLCFHGLIQSSKYSWERTALETLAVLEKAAAMK